ncbi:hypothetical protein C9374_012019 [Naegleria lovaniensis]|uniref:Guanylate cyclase domain-containing protein n=1 Tax=Naegleria lovaniensis TaxID=51637 RepID=A0AA88GBT6_NAELO|nr:uncharacterized protein C9374_012019 [Naegleria lovaniensis]KAG2373556.1 hypothetical protein C9374_012019 [Naegleria lovaniensis]
MTRTEDSSIIGQPEKNDEQPTIVPSRHVSETVLPASITHEEISSKRGEYVLTTNNEVVSEDDPCREQQHLSAENNIIVSDEKRLSEGSSCDSRKGRTSSCMKNSRSIYEMFMNGELGDDLQDDGDDRFKANSNRRKQLAASWQTLTPQQCDVSICLDPKLIELQIERKKQALEKNGEDLTKIVCEANGSEYKFPMPSSSSSSSSSNKNISPPVVATTNTTTRKRSITDPVNPGGALGRQRSFNAPTVSVSPLNSPTDEEGTKPLYLNNEIIISPVVSPSSTTPSTSDTTEASPRVRIMEEDTSDSELTHAAVDKKQLQDLVVDDLPSAYNIVTNLKKPRRTINNSSAKRGYTTNRPSSLSITFNTVTNLNTSIKRATKEPVEMRSIHRNSVVSNKSVTTEPSEFESPPAEFQNKLFDLFCSVKVVLFILFIATVAMCGLIIWCTSYLMLEFQVIQTMATSSNEDITSLLKNSWVSSVVNFAPYILTNTRSVMVGIHGNMTMKETISSNHIHVQRKLFAQMVSRSTMFNQIFAVDVSGSYFGVVIDLPSGTESFIVFNNTKSIYITVMKDGNLIPGTEMEIPNFEDPTSNSTFGMLKQSIQKQVEEDEKRIANGLDPLETSVWSSIFYTKSSGETSVSCVIPYYSGKRYTGFLSLSFSIGTLSNKLRTQTQLEKGNRAFIIRKDGAMLGSTHGLENVTTVDGSLLQAHHVQDAVVSSITQQLFSMYGTFDPIYNSKALNTSNMPRSIFLRDSLGAGHFVTIMSLTDNNDDALDWIIIHTTPKDIASKYLGLSNVIILIVTLVVIAIASGVSVLVSVLISRPLGSLKRRVDRMAQMNFKTKDESVPITFSEVRSIITSVNNMGKGLRSFSKYVPSDIVASIVQSNQPAALGVQWKVVTLYFSDIASFTNMTEKMSPDLLVELMCDFFTHQTDIIMSTKGTIDKFIGDSIMAFWNDPTPIRDHELAAVESAYLCQQALVPFNNRWRERLCSQKNRYNVDYSNFTLKVRIGLHTGECFIGNIGSVDRMNYTCIGDAVNTSSRLESLNSMYGTSIMISENVYAKVHRKFLCKWVDVVCVKGKAIPINIYSVIDKKEHASSEVIKMCAAYQALREMFLNLRFEEAVEFIEANEDILSYMSESKETASYQLIKKKCMERMDLDFPENEEDLFWIATKLNEK